MMIPVVPGFARDAVDGRQSATPSTKEWTRWRRWASRKSLRSSRRTRSCASPSVWHRGRKGPSS